jgi:hypothetical protein
MEKKSARECFNIHRHFSAHRVLVSKRLFFEAHSTPGWEIGKVLPLFRNPAKLYREATVFYSVRYTSRKALKLRNGYIFWLREQEFGAHVVLSNPRGYMYVDCPAQFLEEATWLTTRDVCDDGQDYLELVNVSEVLPGPPVDAFADLPENLSSQYVFVYVWHRPSLNSGMSRTRACRCNATTCVVLKDSTIYQRSILLPLNAEAVDRKCSVIACEV